jgi:hypothetical protein
LEGTDMTIENLNIKATPGPAPIVKRRRIRIIIDIKDMDTVDSRDETYFILNDREVASTVYDIIEQPTKGDGELPPIRSMDLLNAFEHSMGPIARELVRQAKKQQEEWDGMGDDL